MTGRVFIPTIECGAAACPERSRRARRHAVPHHLVFLLVVALVAGCAVSPRPDFPKIAPLGPLDPSASRAENNLTIYDWVGGTVEKYYHDPHMNGVDWAAAVARHRTSAESAADDDGLYWAINGLLGEIKDRHVYVLAPREIKERKEHRFIGFGFELGSVVGNRNSAVVENVWPGCPAAESGVCPGWILQTCDGEPAKRQKIRRRAGIQSQRSGSLGLTWIFHAVGCALVAQRGAASAPPTPG